MAAIGRSRSPNISLDIRQILYLFLELYFTSDLLRSHSEYNKEALFAMIFKQFSLKSLKYSLYISYTNKAHADARITTFNISSTFCQETLSISDIWLSN